MNHKLTHLRVGDTLIAKKAQARDGEVRVLPGDKAICIDTAAKSGVYYLFLFEGGDVLYCKPSSIERHFHSSPIGFMPKFANVKFDKSGRTAEAYRAGFFDEVWSSTGPRYLKLKHKI